MAHTCIPPSYSLHMNEHISFFLGLSMASWSGIDVQRVSLHNSALKKATVKHVVRPQVSFPQIRYITVLWKRFVYSNEIQTIFFIYPEWTNLEPVGGYYICFEGQSAQPALRIDSSVMLKPMGGPSARDAPIVIDSRVQRRSSVNVSERCHEEGRVRDPVHVEAYVEHQ